MLKGFCQRPKFRLADCSNDSSACKSNVRDFGVMKVPADTTEYGDTRQSLSCVFSKSIVYDYNHCPRRAESRSPGPASFFEPEPTLERHTYILYQEPGY